MTVKNIGLILTVVLIITLIFSTVVFYTGCKKEIKESEVLTDQSLEEIKNSQIKIADETIKETIPSTIETEPAGDFYVSSSKDFDDYSFVCPENFNIYEAYGGSRLLLKNTNNTGLIETIFIFVEDISANEVINSDSDVFDFYLKEAEGDETVDFFEEQNIKIDGYDSKIIGYSYQSKLDESIEERDLYIDYYTFIKKDDFLYSIKYISNNTDKYYGLDFFKDFIGSFQINDGIEGASKNTDRKDKESSVNILILGDDSGKGRPGGRVNGRTDIIILLHLNLDKCKGTAVTIPRDTWIEIPGHGEGKINGAHALGGNELTVKTIEKLSGLEIDNYIITDFDGFVPLIDFLGGVTVYVGEDLSDGFSGCYLSKGVHHLDGEQALALSRNRHRKGDGSTQSGAFAREREAAKIIVSLLEQKSTFERIAAMPLFVNYLLRYTWTDLKFSEIVRLLIVLGKIAADDIEITTIPSWPQAFGKASAVAYDAEATAELFEEIKDQ